MSQAAYMQAIKTALQTLLTNDFPGGDFTCDLSLDGQPKPASGKWFVAIHPGSWRGASGDYDLTELIGVDLTITRKIGDVPKDLWAMEAWKKEFEPLARRIVVSIHKINALMQAANALVTKGDDKFHQPLQFQGATKPDLKGFDWFSAVPNQAQHRFQSVEHHNPPPMGLAQTLNFAGAVRMQAVQYMSEES